MPTSFAEAKKKLFEMLDQMKYRRPVWEEYVIFEDAEKGYLKLRLWTNFFNYTLTLSVNEDYLACYSESRMSRPGERFRKGNDLHSGRFNQETFDQIIKDMFSYELVSLYKKNNKKKYSDVNVSSETVLVREEEVDSPK